jgi:membrane associated rhomboid family serine protease
MKFKFYAIKLSAIIFLIFLAQVFFSGFTDFLVLNQFSWSQPWRFVSSIFLHANAAHLVLNLFALMLFGSILETLIGGKRMLFVFFTTGILANLISVNFYSSSLGASGAIFGILGTLVILRPLMVVWAFGMPMPMFIAGIIWAAADLLGAYGFLVGNPIDSTGNIAHLSGMFFGLLFGLLYQKLIRRTRRINVSIDEHEVRQWEKTWMPR